MRNRDANALVKRSNALWAAQPAEFTIWPGAGETLRMGQDFRINLQDGRAYAVQDGGEGLKWPGSGTSGQGTRLFKADYAAVLAFPVIMESETEEVPRTANATVECGLCGNEAKVTMREGTNPFTCPNCKQSYATFELTIKPRAAAFCPTCNHARHAAGRPCGSPAPGDGLGYCRCSAP